MSITILESAAQPCLNVDWDASLFQFWEHLKRCAECRTWYERQKSQITTAVLTRTPRFDGIVQSKSWQER